MKKKYCEEMSVQMIAQPKERSLLIIGNGSSGNTRTLEVNVTDQKNT